MPKSVDDVVAAGIINALNKTLILGNGYSGALTQKN